MGNEPPRKGIESATYYGFDRESGGRARSDHQPVLDEFKESICEPLGPDCDVCGHSHRNFVDDFEHFLRTKGTLVRTYDRSKAGVPSPRPGIWVPGDKIADSQVAKEIRKFRKIMTDLGYLEKIGGTVGTKGIWRTVPGKKPRKLSVREIHEYMNRTYPLYCTGGCKGHGCHCCRKHHWNTYNQYAHTIHQIARWMHYDQTFRDKPAWSHRKLLAVYDVTPKLQNPGEEPPKMTPIAKAHRFQEWLETQEGVSAKCYAYMTYLGQEFGMRYREVVQAEYRPVGPIFRVDWDAGVYGKVHITGKGRGGDSKTRTVTLTPARRQKLEEILAWRNGLGEDIDHVLFPTTSKSCFGNARNPEDPGTVNTYLRKFGGRFNESCEREDHLEWRLDLRKLTTHRLWRPVFITQRAKAGVPDKLMMNESGIEDKKTLHRYQRFSDEETAEILVRADRTETVAEKYSKVSDPIDALEAALSRMGAYERSLVEPLIRGAMETLKELQRRASNEQNGVRRQVPASVAEPA